MPEERAMRVDVREAGRVRIIDLHGRLVLGTTDPLKETLQQLLAAKNSRILINLHGVPYLDSAGIGEIAACKKRALEKSGEIKILKPAGKYHMAVETVLELMFSQSIFEDEMEAVGSF
jgi:anti-sigma B factor antagonist